LEEGRLEESVNGSAKIMKTGMGVDELDGGEERTYAAPIILSAFLSVPIKKTASATVPIHIGNIHIGRLQLVPPPEGMFGWTAAYSPGKVISMISPSPSLLAFISSSLKE